MELQNIDIEKLLITIGHVVFIWLVAMVLIKILEYILKSNKDE